MKANAWLTYEITWKRNSSGEIYTSVFEFVRKFEIYTFCKALECDGTQIVRIRKVV